MGMADTADALVVSKALSCGYIPALNVHKSEARLLLRPSPNMALVVEIACALPLTSSLRMPSE